MISPAVAKLSLGAALLLIGASASPVLAQRLSFDDWVAGDNIYHENIDTTVQNACARAYRIDLDQGVPSAHAMRVQQYNACVDTAASDKRRARQFWALLPPDVVAANQLVSGMYEGHVSRSDVHELFYSLLANTLSAFMRPEYLHEQPHQLQ